MENPRSARPVRRGFTLTELMVTIVIVVVLASIVFIAARRAIESAKIARNMGTLRDLGNSFSAYSSEYGHYPPGWDGNYGLGPDKQNGDPMSGRGPDLVNAYLGSWEMNDRWLSPTVGGRLVGYNGRNQPTNYSGHPALCYNGSDQRDPLPRTVVRRPSEIFLLLDGIPKGDDASKNSQTSVRQWYALHRISDRSRANRPLTIDPSGGNENNGPDFRNRGKCHVLFCDGHVEAFGPEDFKVKHVAIRF